MASCPSDSEDEDQQLSEEDEEVEDEEVDFDLAAGNDDKLIEIAHKLGGYDDCKYKTLKKTQYRDLNIQQTCDATKRMSLRKTPANRSDLTKMVTAFKGTVRAFKIQTNDLFSDVKEAHRKVYDSFRPNITAKNLKTLDMRTAKTRVYLEKAGGTPKPLTPVPDAGIDVSQIWGLTGRRDKPIAISETPIPSPNTTFAMIMDPPNLLIAADFSPMEPIPTPPSRRQSPASNIQDPMEVIQDPMEVDMEQRIDEPVLGSGVKSDENPLGDSQLDLIDGSLDRIEEVSIEEPSLVELQLQDEDHRSSSNHDTTEDIPQPRRNRPSGAAKRKRRKRKQKAMDDPISIPGSLADELDHKTQTRIIAQKMRRDPAKDLVQFPGDNPFGDLRPVSALMWGDPPMHVPAKQTQEELIASREFVHDLRKMKATTNEVDMTNLLLIAVKTLGGNYACPNIHGNVLSPSQVLVRAESISISQADSIAHRRPNRPRFPLQQMSIVKETGELMADFNISLSLKEEEEGEVQQSDLYDDIGGGTADLTNPPLPYGADISTEMRESALKNVDLRRRKVHDRPVNPRSNIGRNSPASAFFRKHEDCLTEGTTFEELVPQGATKKDVAKLFGRMLVLANRGQVKVEQDGWCAVINMKTI